MDIIVCIISMINTGPSFEWNKSNYILLTVASFAVRRTCSIEFDIFQQKSQPCVNDCCLCWILVAMKNRILMFFKGMLTISANDGYSQFFRMILLSLNHHIEKGKPSEATIDHSR